MSNKVFGMDNEEISVIQSHELWRTDSQTQEALFSAHSVQVRDPQKIPKKLREFFKVDLKTGANLPSDRKIFLSQVLMHEIDEGTRLLCRAGKLEIAEMVRTAHPRMHLSNQLRLLRDALEEKSVSELPPEVLPSGFKIRNNQSGQISGKLKNGRYHALSSEGILYKNRNEDALLVEPEREVLAVLDGMGGHSGGNVASCVMADFLEYGLQHGMDLEKAICFGNEAILERAKNDAKLGGAYPMGTTLAAVQIHGDKLKTIHVGDTKLLVVRHGKIAFETLDHTNGQSLYREGLVDADTAHFLNHILSRNLGTDPILPNRDLEKNSFTLKSGDRILMASDGITDNFYSRDFKLDELAQLASKGELTECAEEILRISTQRIKAGKLPSGYRAKPDNLSLLLYQHR